MTSLTESTTIPTIRLRRFSTITTVNALYSAFEQLNFNRISTIGTIVPRKFTTPFIKSGALATLVGGS